MTLEQGSTKRGKVMFSKKRYHDIEVALRTKISDDETLTFIMQTICGVLNFDPHASTYNENQAQQIKNYRKKLRDLGLPARGTLKMIHTN